MILDLKNYEEGSGAELACPHCGNFHLHHICIDAFERSEDAETGSHIIISAEGTKQDNNMEGNPSSRRHGLSIRFTCEDCGKESVMTIAQHKGATLVDMS